MSDVQCPNCADKCRRLPRCRPEIDFKFQIMYFSQEFSIDIYHECAIRMLQSAVCTQYRIIWLDDGRRNLWRRINGKLQFRFFPIIDRYSFHQLKPNKHKQFSILEKNERELSYECCEAATRATAERVENQKSLDASAQVGQLANSIQCQVDDLLSYRVMAARIVVGSVFFAGYQLFGMEQLPICTSAHFIHDSRLCVDAKIITIFAIVDGGSISDFISAYLDQ